MRSSSEQWRQHARPSTDYADNLWMVLYWQIDFELRSFSGLAGDTDTSAVLFHDLLHDRQPETRAAFLRREKWFKDPVARRFVHSLATIRNRNARVTLRRLTVTISLRRPQLRRDQHF